MIQTVVRLVVSEIADKQFALELRALLEQKRLALEAMQARTPLQNEVLAQLTHQVRKLDAFLKAAA